MNKLGISESNMTRLHESFKEHADNLNGNSNGNKLLYTMSRPKSVPARLIGNHGPQWFTIKRLGEKLSLKEPKEHVHNDKVNLILPRPGNKVKSDDTENDFSPSLTIKNKKSPLHKSKYRKYKRKRNHRKENENKTEKLNVEALVASVKSINLLKNMPCSDKPSQFNDINQETIISEDKQTKNEVHHHSLQICSTANDQQENDFLSSKEGKPVRVITAAKQRLNNDKDTAEESVIINDIEVVQKETAAHDTTGAPCQELLLPDKSIQTRKFKQALMIRDPGWMQSNNGSDVGGQYQLPKCSRKAMSRDEELSNTLNFLYNPFKTAKTGLYTIIHNDQAIAIGDVMDSNKVNKMPTSEAPQFKHFKQTALSNEINPTQTADPFKFFIPGNPMENFQDEYDTNISELSQENLRLFNKQNNSVKKKVSKEAVEAWLWCVSEAQGLKASERMVSCLLSSRDPMKSNEFCFNNDDVIKIHHNAL